MRYAYKHLKKPQAFIKKIKGYNLVSMTISYDNQTPVRPTYLVTMPKFDKDNFSSFSFSTFSKQLVNDYLKENASGLYMETTPYTYVVTLGLPKFDFRFLNIGKNNYCLLHLTDCGLVYHMLFSEKGYQLPYGLQSKALTDKQSQYDLLELLNYDLLGRLTSSQVTGLVSANYDYDLNHSISNFSVMEKGKLNVLKVKAPYGTYNVNYDQIKQIKVVPNFKSQADLLKLQTMPKATYRLIGKNSEVDLKITTMG